jgi:hypothetical protein
MTVLLVVLFFTIVILANLARRGTWHYIKKRRTNSCQPDPEHPSNSTTSPPGGAPCDQRDRNPRIAA